MLYDILSFAEGDFPAGLGWHDRILAGFPQTSLWTLSRFLGVEAEHTAALVGLPLEELNWKKRGQALTPTVSDKLFKIARAYQRLVVVLKNEDDVRNWLRSGRPELNGQIPILLLMTQSGSQDVMNVANALKPVETVEMNIEYDEPLEDDQAGTGANSSDEEEDEPRELA